MTASDEEQLKQTLESLNRLKQQQGKTSGKVKGLGDVVFQQVFGDDPELRKRIDKAMVKVKKDPYGQVIGARIEQKTLTAADVEAERDKEENDFCTDKPPPGYLNIKKGSGKKGDLGSFVLDDKYIADQNAATKLLDKNASDKNPPETQRNSPSQDGRAAASGESIKQWKESLGDLDKREQEQTTLGEY